MARHETSSSYKDDKSKSGSRRKAQKARKTHEMQLQLDIYKGAPMGKIKDKVQEDYEAPSQGHGGTKKWTAGTLRRQLNMGTNYDKGSN